MTRVEERLRAAAQAVALTVPEDTAPPLRLPARRHRFAAGPQLVLAARWLRRVRAWLTPMGAATAVLGAVAVPLAIPELLTVPSGAAFAGPNGAPAYYVALSANPAGGHAAVRSTTSGQTLATVAAQPSLAFNLVTAAANDQTFVLGAALARGQKQGRTAGQERLFTLRFDQQADAATLAAVPGRLRQGAPLWAALSPDGGRLAYAGVPRGGRLAISVVTLATGASRTWTRRYPGLGPGLASAGSGYLTWAASGRAVRFGWPYVAGQQVAIMSARLNTGWPGGRLPAVAVLPAGVLKLPGTVRSVAMSTGGTLLITSRVSGGDPAWAVSEFSSTRPVPGLGSVPQVRESASMPRILWVNSAGSDLIVRTGRSLGVISNGLYSLLPSPFARGSLGGPSSLAW